jgi:hypothetical protein
VRLAGDEGVGAGGCLLVVIQQAGGGLASVTVLVDAVGQGAGVLADQVVQPVPALSRLGQQVLVVQGLQAAAGGRRIRAVQRGGGVGVDVGAGVQAQPPEQPLLVPGQVGIRQIEGGGHGHVLGGHQLQPVTLRGQFGGPAGQRPGRVVLDLAGHQADRQRQVPAQPGDLRHCRVGRA